MKKILLIATVATMALSANAQLRSDIVTNENETQLAVLVAPTTECQMAGVDQASKPSKAEGDALKAYYKRPAGAFYTPFYTRDDQDGTWGYNSPWLHMTAYVPMTYVNASTGASQFAWSAWCTTGWSKEEVTSTDTDFTIEHPVVMADSVPTLVATEGDQSASYYLHGYNNTPAIVRSTVFTYPNWQYSTSSTANVRHAWETSKYVALRHPRYDDQTAAATYYTINSQYAADGAQKAYFFGRNTRGYDYAAIAYEKPTYPYILNHVGMKYQGLAWTEEAATSGVAQITAYVYKLPEIPAYDETNYVLAQLGDYVASGTASLSAALSPASAILSIPVFDENGVAPEINDNIMVIVTGYNAEGSPITDITMTVSKDNEDEGYGELGYVGVTTDNGIMFVGLNNFLATGIKTAPSIFIETERPWLCFNSANEQAEREFAPEGEEYTLELFSYHPSVEWTVSEVTEGEAAPRMLPGKVNVPSWLGLDFEDETGSGVGYAVNAIFNVEPLPSGVDHREATIRFAYPGAYLDYKVTQNQVTTSITTVTANEDDTNAPTYNMMGQRVSPDTKGILIRNGKKVIVR